MKVIYKENILTKLDDALHESIRLNKEISHFTVTPIELAEMKELCYCTHNPDNVSEYNGVEIRVGW